MKQIESVNNDASASSDVQVKQSNSELKVRPPSSRSISSASQRNKNAKNWSKDEVKAWFNSNDMVSLGNIFKDCSGVTLKGMWEMKQKDYTQFCGIIEKEIEKSKIEVQYFEKFNFYELLERTFSI